MMKIITEVAKTAKIDEKYVDMYGKYKAKIDLSIMEEAEAYESLMKDFNYTQQDVANFVGKSRSHIANIIRLLELPQEVKELLYQKKIDMGHARALINCDRAVEIANTIVEASLSVRETEKLVRDYNQEKINLKKKLCNVSINQRIKDSQNLR